MTALPLPDNSFDVVVSSLAIHNLPSKEDRAEAIAQIARVLKSRGRVLITDIRHTRAYAEELTALGFDVTTRSTGPRFWFGSPFVAASLVSAQAPAS